MKKLTFQIAVIALMAAGISLASCSKEGPAGPAGPAGAAGPTGAQGPAGVKGDDGTANVIYSEWLDVTFDAGYGTIAAPQLTTDILNSGEIKVYWNLNTAEDPFIVQVPCVVPLALLTGNEDDADEPDIYIDPYFETEAIHLLSNYNPTSSEGVSQFRYILIPGGVSARKAAGIDWNDYNQVKKYLNLKD
jgi:hypothetical protein